MYTKKLAEINALCTKLQIPPSDHLLWINISQQKLVFFEKNQQRCDFSVSTSRFGIGNKEGSGKTPLGLHRVCEKIGHGAPTGRIFKDRLDTGKDWDSSFNEDNLILTRIIRLKGLEDGKNLGSGIDTFERYIYIHGTNQEALIGSPISHGCICMKNNDIINLFDLIEEGALVYID